MNEQPSGERRQRKKYVGSLHPQANIDLKYIVDTIKATDDGFNSNWYAFNFSKPEYFKLLGLYSHGVGVITC